MFLLFLPALILSTFPAEINNVMNQLKAISADPLIGELAGYQSRNAEVAVKGLNMANRRYGGRRSGPDLSHNPFLERALDTYQPKAHMKIISKDQGLQTGRYNGKQTSAEDLSADSLVQRLAGGAESKRQQPVAEKVMGIVEEPQTNGKGGMGTDLEDLSADSLVQSLAGGAASKRQQPVAEKVMGIVEEPQTNGKGGMGTDLEDLSADSLVQSLAGGAKFKRQQPVAENLSAGSGGVESRPQQEIVVKLGRDGRSRYRWRKMGPNDHRVAVPVTRTTGKAPEKKDIQLLRDFQMNGQAISASRELIAAHINRNPLSAFKGEVPSKYDLQLIQYSAKPGPIPFANLKDSDAKSVTGKVKFQVQKVNDRLAIVKLVGLGLGGGLLTLPFWVSVPEPKTPKRK